MYQIALTVGVFALAGLLGFIAHQVNPERKYIKSFYLIMMLLIMVFGTYQLAMFPTIPETRLEYIDGGNMTEYGDICLNDVRVESGTDILPYAYDVQGGTYVAGNISNLTENDGTYLIFREGAVNALFHMDFNWTVEEHARWMRLNGRYDGHPGHSITVYAYNWVSESWDELDPNPLTRELTDQDYEWIGVNNSAQINATGGVWIRFNHSAFVNEGDEMYFDRLEIVLNPEETDIANMYDTEQQWVSCNITILPVTTYIYGEYENRYASFREPVELVAWIFMWLMIFAILLFFLVLTIDTFRSFWAKDKKPEEENEYADPF